MGRPSVAMFAVAMALLVGCGGSDSEDTATGPLPSEGLSSGPLRNLVTEQDLSEEPKDSPERALLSWFQAVQFGDVIGVELATSVGARSRVGRARLREAVRIVGPALGKPIIVAVRGGEGQANVRVVIEGYDAESKAPVSREAESFQFVHETGAWRVQDLSYLLEAADAIAAAS